MIVLPDAENRTIVSPFVWTKHRNVTEGQSARDCGLHCEQCGCAVKMFHWPWPWFSPRPFGRIGPRSGAIVFCWGLMLSPLSRWVKHFVDLWLLLSNLSSADLVPSWNPQPEPPSIYCLLYYMRWWLVRPYQITEPAQSSVTESVYYALLSCSRPYTFLFITLSFKTSCIIRSWYNCRNKCAFSFRGLSIINGE